MSRVFTAAGENIAIPAAALFNNFTTVTIAAWVNLSDFGTGAPIVVKDIGTYETYLWVNSDGTIFGSYGGNSLTGGAQAVHRIAGGAGYAFGDQIQINGGSPDAVASIFEVTGGVVNTGSSAVGVNGGSFGNGYTVGQVCTTTKLTGSGNDALTLMVDTLTGNVNSGSTSNEKISLDTWAHIAMTVSGGVVKLYINGVECTYSAQTTTGTEDTSAGGYNIGSDTEGDNPIGDIAEVAIYTTALTGVQIAALAASTTGAPILPDGYWHLCGTASPEPDSSGNGNDGVLSSPAPGAGPDSPGSACFGAVATVGTVGVGVFHGSSLATAFYNPHSLDLIQVVNEGGEVVWSLTSSGVAAANPGSHTSVALLGRYDGSSFDLAFANPYSLDIFQIVSQGDGKVFWVDATGSAHSA